VTDETPSQVVESRDGTLIAVYCSGTGSPLVLVHGATADHTAFRVVGPLLATTFTVHAIDRRGRGWSGDTAPYSIEREFEDVAAVADAIASESGAGVDVVGHSYGGRCALGASLRTGAVRRVVSYEGAPAPPGVSYHPPGIEARLHALLDAGDADGALAAFLTEVVGMSAAALAAYRADPIWHVRAAATGTILRELQAEADPVASVAALGAVRQRCSRSWAGIAWLSSARRPWLSTPASPTAGSSSSTAHGTPPTTRTPPNSSRPSRRSSDDGPSGSSAVGWRTR